MKYGSLEKTRNIVCLALALSILFEALYVVEGTTYFSMAIQATILIDSPLVTLQNLTSNSVIYTNNTSSKITVSNETHNSDVLEILNQTIDNWQLQLIKYSDDNISRLTNCTIWFHDGSTTSLQIGIIGGEYNKTSGNYYDLVGSGEDRVTITASTNATGTSYIHTYLKILKPNTSTYSLYVITFEVT